MSRKGEYLGTEREELRLMNNYDSFRTQGETPGRNERLYSDKNLY